jgi:long-chain acyl-CoA synthetase
MSRILNKQVDYYTTFPEYLEGIEKKFGDRPALTSYNRKQEEKKLSYQELVQRCREIAVFLSGMDLRNKKIAIVGENSIDWICAYLAITSIGSTAVCVDAEQSDENLREMIMMSDSEAVFASASVAGLCGQLLGEGAIKFLYHMGGLGEHSMDEICTDGRKLLEEEQNKDWRFPAVNGEQIAQIAFTSGTTSTSKMVMLSHRNILTNASDSICDVEAGPKVFSALPCYHTYGMTAAVLATLVRGAHLCINGDLRTVMRDMKLFGPYSMLTVPLMVEAIHKQIWLAAERDGQEENLRKLLKSGGKRWISGNSNRILEAMWEKSFGGMRLIISGGAHLSGEIQEEFAQFGVQILQGYGITECSPMVSVNGNDENRIGSVGRALNHSSVRVKNEEIQVKGDCVMQGYYKSPQLTDEAMDGEWFCTGDLGYIDKDGFIFITGRKKNLIVFKNGKKLSPEKLEMQIAQSPYVKEVMVYGASKGASADDVSLAASIYPDPDRTGHMSAYDILDLLQKHINQMNQELPLYQQIQLINIREQEFKKTASQKIKRYLV